MIGIVHGGVEQKPKNALHWAVSGLRHRMEHLYALDEHKLTRRIFSSKTKILMHISECTL